MLPKGTRGQGHITWRTGKGAFGKSAKMDLAFDWIDVSGRRVTIEGTHRQEGEGNTAATLGAVAAVGPFRAFVTGKSATVPRGMPLKAFTAEGIQFQAANLAHLPWRHRCCLPGRHQRSRRGRTRWSRPCRRATVLNELGRYTRGAHPSSGFSSERPNQGREARKQRRNCRDHLRIQHDHGSPPTRVSHFLEDVGQQFFRGDRDSSRAACERYCEIVLGFEHGISSAASPIAIAPIGPASAPRPGGPKRSFSCPA